MPSQPTNPLHRAALRYAARGIAVFPCRPGAKEPATPKGVYEATTDAATINSWWRNNPNYNIGIAPGPSGMCVLDVDPPLGEQSLALLETIFGTLPNTLTIRTPRGGYHYWFKGDLPNTVGKLGPKLDTRGSGGYVLAPPSQVEGNTYTVHTRAPVAAIPVWLAIEAGKAREKFEAAKNVVLDLPANVDRARSLLKRYIRDGHVAIEGSGGDARTYQVACEVLNFGLNPKTAWNLLLDGWNDACVPPWDTEELAQKVINASEYAQNEAGAWAVPPAQELFKHFIGCQTPAANGRFRFLRDAQLDELPEPSWLLDGVLPDEGIGLIYGPTQQYKSFLALDLALTIATGIEKWGSSPRQPGAVFYAAAEAPRGIARQRVPAWRTAHKINGELPFYFCLNVPRIFEPSEVSQFIDEITASGEQPKLVVIDTAARSLAGMNENDARDISLFVEALETIRKTFSCMVLAIHHTGKDEGRGARGSSALEAAMDTNFEVKADRQTRLVTVTCKKQKDADAEGEPWYFEGVNVGPSLVFNQLSTADYHKLAKGADLFEPAKIGTVLRKLKAVTPERAVNTHVLSHHLTEPQKNESAEDFSAAHDRVAKLLTTLGTTKLQAYTIGRGKAMKWYLPGGADETAF